MPEIGVERLGAGDRQEHRPQGEETDLAVAGEKEEAAHRIESAQDLQIIEHVRGAGHPDGEEPEGYDRAEQGGDLRGSPRLEREQRHQDRDRQRQDEVLERRRGELEALDGGEHGNRRRDERVAIEEAGADNAERDHDRAAS